MTAELLPISVIIIVANLLVFVLFFLRRNLRTATNYFLIGLAFSDFLTGAVNIPLFLAFLYGYQEVRKNLSVYHSFTATLCAYHILVITAEKFFAIIQPLRHHQMTKKLALFIIIVVWCCSSLFVFIQLAWGDNNDGEEWELKQTIYVLFHITAVFVIPYAFMIYAYWTMFRAISHSKGNLLRNARGESSISGRLKQVRIERKCLTVFAVMALFYAICWFPWFLVVALLQLGYSPSKLKVLMYVYTIVRYLTSAFNPIVYTFFKRDFKNALKSLILRRSARSQARATLLKSLGRPRSKSQDHKENRCSYSGLLTTNTFLCGRTSSVSDGKFQVSYPPISLKYIQPPVCSIKKTKTSKSLDQLYNNATDEIVFSKKEGLQAWKSEQNIRKSTPQN